MISSCMEKRHVVMYGHVVQSCVELLKSKKGHKRHIDLEFTTTNARTAPNTTVVTSFFNQIRLVRCSLRADSLISRKV